MNFKNEFINQYGVANHDESDLANFVNENWTGITGLSNDERDDECDFPSEVTDLINDLGLDYDDFSASWGDVREGDGGREFLEGMDWD